MTEPARAIVIACLGLVAFVSAVVGLAMVVAP